MPKNYEKMAKNRLYGKHYKLKTDIDLHVKNLMLFARIIKETYGKR